MSHIVKINVFMICIFIIFKLVYFTTINNKQQKMFFSKLATMYALPLLFSPKSGLAWFFNCLIYLNFVDDIVIKQIINSTYLFFNVVRSAVGKQEQKRHISVLLTRSACWSTAEKSERLWDKPAMINNFMRKGY